MATFFLIWQDPQDRSWHPVGRLDRVGRKFTFVYTEGARVSSRFVPFGNLTSLTSIYVSDELFPIFANRVLSEKRPEYLTYARWSGLEKLISADPLMLMARMGGGRATDSLQVYPMPERGVGDVYQTVFFLHGLSHLPEMSQRRASSLFADERLFPMLDLQNAYDANAVALRAAEPSVMLGYCPRHLAADFRTLVERSSSRLDIRVTRVNPDAPPQYRVLCEARAQWPADFQPCGGREYSAMVPYDPRSLVARLEAEDASGGSRQDRSRYS